MHASSDSNGRSTSAYARREDFIKEFDFRYRPWADGIRDLLNNRRKTFKHKHQRFEFFMLPFQDVDEFRAWFQEELTYATRLSAGGVADECATQILRQGEAQVFKKYSQMKLQMKREALKKLNRRAK